MGIRGVPSNLDNAALWEIFEADFHPGRRSGETQAEMAARFDISVATLRRLKRDLEARYGDAASAKKMMEDQRRG